ncbi:CLUMA_CG001660, isoform A [Clunio marinus]|uniref:CLUMA_CG001660, isoform A n=1 Tax=Clunio marinus TaxID=568069 RepID=A0A1J1HNR7_9DIPT|nr:CLUMA_CG001660, isoform A [Clunio marinus]
MWKCNKCQKPVYFAERQQSLGFDWHPECLRCHECGKRLSPGQHAEHKGVPYCHVPCYGALFGPQLFGHGTRVESHKSYGQKINPPPKSSPGPTIPRTQLENKLKVYNQFYNNKSLEVKARDVNGKLILEGALRIYWGIQGVIHLKEDDDQRTVVTIRKRYSVRYPNSVDIIRESTIGSDQAVAASDNETTVSESLSYDTISISSEINSLSSNSNSSSKESSPAHISNTLPSKLDVKKIEWDEIDDLLQVERREDDQRYSTMPLSLSSSMTDSQISNVSLDTDTASFKTLSPDGGESTSQSSSIYYSQLDSSNDKCHDDEDTPTLKPCDFEDFKRQMSEDFVNGTNEMPKVNDGTLKFNQPIDPSRINDSLKLYQENIMSKSMQSEDGLSAYSLSNSFCIPGQINSFNIQDTLNLLKHSSSSSSSDDKTLRHESNKMLKKSISSPDDGSWSSEKGIARSKSGPNHALIDFESDTVKPSGRPATSINIKMDCYDDIKVEILNGSSGSASTVTTPIDDDGTDNVVLRKKQKGSTAIKRRSGNRRSRTKLKRRCSINGHFYNRETSFFTPPTGSQMSVYATSLLSTQEIISLVMDKYRVESKAENFALFIVRDNGEQKKLSNEDYPLLTRVLMGPHEDVARLFLMDAQEAQEISSEVAQFLNLSIPECRAIIERYYEEEERELYRIREKYSELRKRIQGRMESLKVRL